MLAVEARQSVKTILRVFWKSENDSSFPSGSLVAFSLRTTISTVVPVFLWRSTIFLPKAQVQFYPWCTLWVSGLDALCVFFIFAVKCSKNEDSNRYFVWDIRWDCGNIEALVKEETKEIKTLMRVDNYFIEKDIYSILTFLRFLVQTVPIGFSSLEAM